MRKLFAAVMLAALVALPAAAIPKTKVEDRAQVMKKIRRELVTLPFYGVFDNLAYRYEDGIVTLYGQVVRPTTRSDAERSVARLAGVESVINQIEVLPLSSFDDQIRLATYRAIYRQPGLDRLALQAVPPIHIIVKRGHVRLEGVAPTRSDAIRAYHAAMGVSGVFSVENNLRIERS